MAMGSRPGERRGGRQKGTPNRLTAEVKDMIRGALEDVGGREYLAQQAIENPVAFLGLLRPFIPREVIADVAVHAASKAAHDEIIAIMRHGAITVDQQGRVDCSAPAPEVMKALEARRAIVDGRVNRDVAAVVESDENQVG